MFELVILRPEFFYFSFYRPSLPNFLEIEKKIKEIFFNFIFYFPPTHAVQLCFFCFCLFLCCQVKLPPVTALGEILPF